MTTSILRRRRKHRKTPYRIPPFQKTPYHNNSAYMKNFLYSLINLSKFSTSSSVALLFRCCFPHLAHWNNIFISELLILYMVGYISPLQIAFLSPGISLSTCKETKQKGQWFLHVLSAFSMILPQWMQANDSLIFFIIASFLPHLTSPAMGGIFEVSFEGRFRGY